MKTVTYKFGFLSALIAFISASGYCLVQILQVFNFIRFPVADILIYSFSLCIAIPYMLAIMAFHRSVPQEKKIWSHASLLMAVMYAVYASFVYVVQLASVVPKMIAKTSASIQVLEMAPHSFFWSLDALTYICLGFSTLFGAFAFPRASITKLGGPFFLANALVTPLIAFVYFYPHFSASLLWIGSLWIITAPGSMLMLALFFHNKRRHAAIQSRNQLELLEVRGIR